jgi:hypothetical protein
MIMICLRGGLGNQLFQYAFARFLAQRHRTELWINKWFYTPNNPNRFRQGYASDNNPNRVMLLQLDKFQIFCQKECEENWQDAQTIKETYPNLKYIVDNGVITPDKAIELGDNLILCGWWANQTGYLFDADFMALIRNELTPKIAINDKEVTFIRTKIENTPNSVAVHVRRGDYQILQDMFCLLGEDYYERAFDAVESRIRAPEYFVFSDDIYWVKRNFRFSRNVSFVETNTVLADFELMRRCRHNINANSTYSWWASYLNPTKDKIVIVPAKYYNHEEWQTEYERREPGGGYLPSTWSKV